MVDYLRILLNARLSQMEDRGASAVEYGLLIAGIAALIVVIVFAFGGVIKSVFSQTCSKINASASVGSSCS
jgi:pilus assembly protein Flp/PilA